jgi:hypothetical protein
MWNLLCVSFKHISNNLTYFIGTPNSMKILYNTSLPYSLNHRLSWSLWVADVLSHSIPIFFSSIWQMLIIWSVIDLLCQNSHWGSPIISFMNRFNLERKIFHNILYVVDNMIAHDNYYSQFNHPFCELHNNRLLISKQRLTCVRTEKLFTYTYTCTYYKETIHNKSVTSLDTETWYYQCIGYTKIQHH